MGLLIDREDFIEEYELVKSPNDKIEAYINIYEKKYLRELLGDELMELFLDDVDPATKQPLTSKFLELYEEFSYRRGYREIYQSIGLKKMLLGFVWFEIARRLHVKVTESGLVNHVVEASSPASLNYVYDIYNTSVKTYNVIQTKCLDENEVYPEWDGIRKSLSSWI